MTPRWLPSETHFVTKVFLELNETNVLARRVGPVGCPWHGRCAKAPLCKQVLSVCNEGWKYPKKDYVGLVALQGEIRKQILLNIC